MFRLKLQGKIVLLTAGLVLLVFSVVIGVSAVLNQSEAVRQAEELAISRSSEFSWMVAARFSTAMDTAVTLAEVLKGLVVGGKADRDAANAILESVLSRNPELLGAWTCWEPNAFDGRDKEFVGTKGHDATGRFVTSWYRKGNTVDCGPLVGYDVPGDGDYYLAPMKTGKGILTEPFEYSYEEGGPVFYLNTLSVPIEIDGKRVGAAGVDLSMEAIQTLTNSIKLYETGFARLVSHGGTVVSHPDRERIGKPLGEIQTPGGVEVLKRIQKGESWFEEAWSEVLGHNTLKSYSPVVVSNTDTPWSTSMVLVEEEVMASYNKIMRMTIVSSIIGGILLLLVIWMIARWLVKPLRRVAGLAQRGGDGDLTIERADFGIETSDELGEMAGALYEMIAKQREAIRAIAGASERLGGVAEEFSTVARESNAGVVESRAGIDDVSCQMENLAAASQEITASVQEVASGAQSSAQKSTDMAAEVEQARTAGEEGVRAIGRAVASIKKVAEDAGESAREVKSLGDRAREIQNFVDQIGGIADQTNLLALNAAIEAARAGEAGRGFAVVAEEVRKLAEESNEAAEKIADLASIITKDLDSVVSSAEVNAKDSLESSGLAEETRETIDKMMEALSNIASATQDMAAVSEEQAASSEEIASAVQTIASRVNDSASSADHVRGQMAEVGASAERVARGSEELSGLAADLGRLVATFKYDEGDAASKSGLVPLNSGKGKSGASIGAVG
ncbi:MAG: methyl-accepting chemotaxis protein [Synergistaceae bacterium]|nr:methyl-accepting chemotaxis protein [Synergistaceae bacterium]